MQGTIDKPYKLPFFKCILQYSLIYSLLKKMIAYVSKMILCINSYLFWAKIKIVKKVSVMTFGVLINFKFDLNHITTF